MKNNKYIVNTMYYKILKQFPNVVQMQTFKSKSHNH